MEIEDQPILIKTYFFSRCGIRWITESLYALLRSLGHLNHKPILNG